ncbi:MULTISPECIES: maleylpyruvate isomerase family mycothiol-dependent enzyme [Streptomyces]|uniref:Maleylpyruvate isomerase family mycothiol-dependent enzyme n=1 Tax=Streptomyces solicathayae TaxID=3081768 RepID=A0ABZ0LZX3_9ACTN|nr:maleylpyruvate isomerase family mycothiol-dependent enzyme [Streptomyces sp. HUAS YS2]WOX25058.1 maleylpyruvate isomerase family mycothiol-dependent enzyme [Streptomyces sp. HUAS YS2]
MIDHVRDLASVREATDRLLDAAVSLDNAALAEPSRLPGWTRGHVLAHLSRNADALVNVLRGLPMYEDAATRDADIERDATRPLDVQLADLRESAERFAAVGAEPADWDRKVELRNGVVDAARRIPFRRWVEVDLHHVDLGIGYELENLPDEFTEREIAFLADRWSGRPDVPPVTLTSHPGGPSWTTGGTEGTPVALEGSYADLLGWLSGRGDKGAHLAVLSGDGLPELPPL